MEKLPFPVKSSPLNPARIFRECGKWWQGIAELSPDFISVTYGAGGSTSKRTVEIASAIQKQHGIPALAHLTCVSSSREDIRNQLNLMKENGLENILALQWRSSQRRLDSRSHPLQICLWS